MSGSYANRYRGGYAYGNQTSESETPSGAEQDWGRRAWFAVVISLAAGFALFVHMAGWA